MLQDCTLTYGLGPSKHAKGKIYMTSTSLVKAVPAGDELDPDTLATGVLARTPVPQYAFKVRGGTLNRG